jgi:thiol:disulfide interchange protein
MLAIVVILLWRVGKPWWLIAGGLAVVVILAWHWQTLRQNVAMLYYLQHVGTNLTLGLCSDAAFSARARRWSPALPVWPTTACFRRRSSSTRGR